MSLGPAIDRGCSGISLTLSKHQALNLAKQTVLADLLSANKFDEARRLLEQQLQKGELMNPRIDKYWAPVADTIAGAIQLRSGMAVATVPFWDALHDFFVTSIEPIWGHAHKGHVYFRLGFAFVKHDLARARREFELAYKEDIYLERGTGGTPEEIKIRSYKYSAYVALAILETIDDADFSTLTDKEQFIDQLFGPSFDAAIAGAAVPSELVQKAIVAIAPPQALLTCQTLYNELQNAASRALPFATVSLTGTVLESLLLADLYHRKGLKTLSNGKDILRVELGPLLQEAIAKSIFLSEAVRAACELVQIFRNRLHPGNELRQQYKLVPRVAMTLKILFDLTLLEWRKAFP